MRRYFNIILMAAFIAIPIAAAVIAFTLACNYDLTEGKLSYVATTQAAYTDRLATRVHELGATIDAMQPAAGTLTP